MEDIDYENKKQEIEAKLSLFYNEFKNLLNKHKIEVSFENDYEGSEDVFFRLKDIEPDENVTQFSHVNIINVRDFI